MEKIHGNMCFCAYTLKMYMKNMHVSMYFLHLELTFTPPPPPPHYIITDKGLLHKNLKEKSLHGDEATCTHTHTQMVHRWYAMCLNFNAAWHCTVYHLQIHKL